MIDKLVEPGFLDPALGRSLDEQIECIRRQGSHGVVPVLRAQVLESFGIPKPKSKAGNLIVFGCYPPFEYGWVLRDYIKILDILGIEYTYLFEESCCGAPMVIASTGKEQRRAIEASKEFIQKNIEMAQQKGSTNISYCCIGCAHMGKGLFTEQAEHLMYLLDLIIDKLERKKLGIAIPKVVGYFEGCHATYRAIFPRVKLEWERYRRLLDRIKNLRVVDLPHSICCRKDPEATVKAAEERNLDTILCPCNGCYHRIGVAARNKLQVKHFVEVVLPSLKGE